MFIRKIKSMLPNFPSRGFGIFSQEDILGQFIQSSEKMPSYVTTQKTAEFAKNHCGAVTITNMAIYFARQGFGSLLINSDPIKTFHAIYNIVGDGPILRLSKKARKYFKECGCVLRYRHIRKTKDLIKSMNDKRIISLLLCESMLSWHWVLAIDYEYDENKEVVFRVLDGWHSNTPRYYRLNRGSKLIFGTEYWIE